MAKSILRSFADAGYGIFEWVVFAGGLITGSVLLGPVADTIENLVANLRK